MDFGSTHVYYGLAAAGGPSATIHAASGIRQQYESDHGAQAMARYINFIINTRIRPVQAYY